MQIKHENGTKEHQLKKMKDALDIERRPQDMAGSTPAVEKPKSGTKLSMITALMIAFVFLLVGAYFGRSKPVAAVAEPEVKVNPFAASSLGGGCGITKPKDGEKPCDDKKKDL